MKVSAVISPKIIKSNNNTIKYDKISLINFFVLSSGLLFGVLTFVLAEDYLVGEIWEYFIKFTTDFSSKTSIEILSGTLLSHAPYIILMVIFGTSVCGIIPIMLISLVKTMGLGLVSAYIYSTYSLKGIEYSFMVFFPGKFVLILSMMIMMYICLNSSRNIQKLSVGESQSKYSLSEYLAKILVGILLFFFSSVIDCLAVVCFSSLFSFV